MRRKATVNLGNLVLSLSEAMDLANPSLARHQQRTAFIVLEMGKIAKLSDESLENVFMAALLHDIGALSVEEKISLSNFEAINVENHCIRGECLLNETPWFTGAAKIVRFHHKEWEDWEESIETPFVLESQMLFLADYIERLIKRDRYILHQHKDIVEKIQSLSGSSFHSQVVDMFLTASEREEYWLDLLSPKLYSILLNEGPFKQRGIDLSNIFIISEIFQKIIDFRSRFTATHSSGVSAASEMLSRIIGLSQADISLMVVAGNLHDLGKMAVSNRILEKPGPLTKEEMAVMKSHTYYTYSVINTIGGLQQVAEWAAFHHEKLDGSGYPFHCKADELNTGARILMVADIFTALTEDRPYRKGMSRKGVVQILKQFSDRKFLDSTIVSLLFENFDEIFSYVTEKQAVAKEFYEKQFAFIDKRKKRNSSASLP